MRDFQAELTMDLDTSPWYKQFWPWAIISIPAATVVAAMFTIVLAVKSEDGLVKDDYYKDGLAINQVIDRDRQAMAHSMRADLLVSPEGTVVEVRLSGDQLPEQLSLKLTHATRSMLDQEIVMAGVGQGIYRANIAAMVPGKWYVELEPQDRQWRLAGEVANTEVKVITLVP